VDGNTTASSSDAVAAEQREAVDIKLVVDV